MTDNILREFHKKGAFYLEDIEEWSDGELEKIKGIGKVRREAIRKILKEELEME